MENKVYKMTDEGLHYLIMYIKEFWDRPENQELRRQLAEKGEQESMEEGA